MEKARLIYLGACMKDCIEDCNIRDLREILENEEADPNVILPELNYTPFHAVAGSEDEDFAEAACRLILIHNGNPNVKADEDLTPVHVAASWGHARVLQVLLEGGGSPWLNDELGKTAFDYAKESNDWATINVLSEFSQKNSQKYGNTMNVLLTRMRNIRKPNKRGSGKGFGRVICKEKSNNVTRLSTHFEENDEKEEALTDNFVDLTASDSEDSESSHKNSEYSKHSEDVHVDKEILTASSSGMSSPVPQTSSSELLSGLECSSVSACTSGNEEPSTSHSSSLPDFVYSSSYVNTRKRHQKKLSFGDGTSQPSLSSSCSERLVPENTRPVYDSLGWRTQGSFDVSDREKSPAASGEVKVTEDTLLNKLPSRKSIARTSIMGRPRIPVITITEPSASPDLTQERLAEYNSPKGVESSEHSYLSKRIQRWVKSVSHFSPLATSSDDTFHTCESNPSVAQRLNTAAFETGLNIDGTDNSIKSCATVSECYKYADEEKGVVLLEERWLANPVPLPDLTQTDQSSSSTAVLHTDTETVDTDHLVKELKSCGIDYGPVTSSTKKVYKLQLRKKKARNASFKHLPSAYSYELQRTLKDKKCMYFMSPGMQLEQVVAQQFAKTGSGVNWREGNLKTSFTYLLLDPRITKNLPCRAASLQPKEVWSVFLKSVFYIGKGKRSRPYSHLYEAVEMWKKGSLRYANAKVKRISEIWLEGLGVVCLHVFQNVIPVEAYTREAAMIDAIGVQNLCNMKRSEYYGKATQWYNYDRNIFGVYLLYRSLQIFLSEGERHLSPLDIM